MSPRRPTLDRANPELAKLDQGLTYMVWKRYDDLDPMLIQPSMYMANRAQCCVFEPLAGGHGGFVGGVNGPSAWPHVSDPENWHHYTYAWNRTTGVRVIYVDGEPVAEDIFNSPSILQEDTYFVVGAHVSVGHVLDQADYASISNIQFFFMGQLDDIALFGRALTGPEVKARWASSLAQRVREGLEPDLVLLYSFDHAGGPTAEESAFGAPLEPNLGTAGSDYDLLYGRLPKDQPLLSRRYRLVGSGEIVDLLPPERTPTPTARSLARFAWPVDRETDPMAPHVVVGREGDPYEVDLGDGSVVSGTVTNASAGEAFA
eukprot:CAMPEP_0206028300 /NCGR_PEP_ID=MMETSP1464-20131121/44724_1 /ASSEMBLY_ACC=CAM_ASM_001124 /TAXON_ID=119497 /ORGANISM="Exanthemachrysis gayraliae, Strain RCC1523" /LENGTH=316 /DNA_ID=CAMNT_0053402353 /DNA_START=17 /DNA_END=964 /DNA_ORIENTATION=-